MNLFKFNIKKYIINILILFFICLFPEIVFSYQIYKPIIIRHSIEGNSASNPLIIEGYEISNPSGPCIFIENVDHVIIRNNYLHNCGTDISAGLIANNPRDDDCLGAMTDFMGTGALNLFRVGSVKVYNNKLENNDYAIRIDGFDVENKINGVEVFDNKIYNTHRSHFLWVKDGKDVLIYNNDIRNNGLGEFFDNAALERIFAGEDLGCMDGRSQGIAVHASENVKIYNNFILNSSSDGIGIADTPGDPYNSTNPSTNVEIYDNEIVENGEMGVWLAGAHNVKIYRNNIYQSKHRVGEIGGSSGIMLETNSVDVEIFENKIYFNDMYGIGISAGLNVDIHNNEILYNGHGGIQLMYLDYVHEQGIKNVNILNNYIHNNREYAIHINKEANLENLVIKNNTFKDNGGGPINHSFYDGNDFSLHLEDWTLDFERVLNLDPEKIKEKIIIEENIGYPEDFQESKVKEDIIKKDELNHSEISYKQTEEKENFETPMFEKSITNPHKSKKSTGIFYVIEQMRESWQATLGAVIIIAILLILIIYYKKNRKRKLY